MVTYFLEIKNSVLVFKSVFKNNFQMLRGGAIRKTWPGWDYDVFILQEKGERQNYYWSIYLSADRASAWVLTLVGCVLHASSHQTVATQKMAFKSLICEESKLTFLTVEGWTVVDHLGMDLHLEGQEINS